jgi:transcriptional regulator with XRE-family HTH domain
MEDPKMANGLSVFWDDLAKDLEDPEFLREYIVESMRIATIDDLVNSLDQAREASGMTKADLARAISVEPAVVRRLFSGNHLNPTIGTVAEVAAALGMRITMERLPAAERKAVTDPLIQGRSTNPRKLAEHLTSMRTRSKTAA